MKTKRKRQAKGGGPSILHTGLPIYGAREKVSGHRHLQQGVKLQ